jgi:ArsR family transcriptional regulator
MSSTAARIRATDAAAPDAVDRLVSLAKAMGDRLRAEILRVLHQDSYAVGELCEMFDVPQPALSHHLKILHQAGLVARRREGNSIFYRRTVPSPTAAALFAGLDCEPVGAALAGRIERIHEQRNQRSARFFEENAAEITAHQAEICEADTYLDAVLEMIDAAIERGAATGHALEVGPGAGALLAQLADRFDRATGVDNSPSMLEAAETTLRDTEGVTLTLQDFMNLPAKPAYDALVAAMVVHHQASPASFFKQAAALLRPGGCILVAELCQHDQEWAQSACGDQWLGFDPDELFAWAERAGLALDDSQYLAQKNGFRLQVHRFLLAGTSTNST